MVSAAGKYRKGARYERAIVNAARSNGSLAFRSAGSKSPVDVVIISHEKRTIKLIQAKAGKSMSEQARNRLGAKYKFLNGTYEVVFEVL